MTHLYAHWNLLQNLLLQLLQKNLFRWFLKQFIKIIRNFVNKRAKPKHNFYNQQKPLNQLLTLHYMFKKYRNKIH